MTHAASAVDPVTLEISRNRLQSVAEEVGTALIRTAHSPNIKDRRDCSAGVYGSDGTLVAQAEHIPLHLGLMPTFVANVIRAIDVDGLEPGDALMVNDTYLGGSHLPDICLVTPVFYSGRLIGFVANMAHHVDIGGMTPGSMSVAATEIFHEGLRIPPLKILRNGDLVDDVFNFMLANTRTAHSTRGDVFAQVAANQLGATRVSEICKEWGSDGFAERVAAVLAYSERRARAAIADLPDGTATFTDYLEHDGHQEVDIPITVTLTKQGENLCFDLTGSGDQVEGSINCSYAVTRACAAYVLKVITDPTLPSNAGLMQSVEVRTRAGSVVDATFPAPVANGNINTSTRIVDAMLGAADLLAPGRVGAASCGSQNVLTIGGIDPKTQRFFSYVETYGGGQGALPDQDGMDGVHTHMTNTRNTPCEVIEHDYPLRVRRYELVPGTGGSGRYHGGLGMRREVELTRGKATFTICTERMRRRPWGLDGGSEGHGSRVTYHTADQATALPPLATVRAVAGDRIEIQTAGGGGYGTPSGPTDGGSQA